MGTWRPDTRAALILEQTREIMKKIPDTAKVGIEDFFTYKSRGRCVLLRMKDYQSMWDLIKAVKASGMVHPQTGDRLWAAKSEPGEERDRKQPISRAVRWIMAEGPQERGIKAEGNYQRGKEAVFLTVDDWATDGRVLVLKQDTGDLEVDEDNWQRFLAGVDPKELLEAANAKGGGMKA